MAIVKQSHAGVSVAHGCQVRPAMPKVGHKFGVWPPPGTARVPPQQHPRTGRRTSPIKAGVRVIDSVEKRRIGLLPSFGPLVGIRVNLPRHCGVASVRTTYGTLIMTTALTACSSGPVSATGGGQAAAQPAATVSVPAIPAGPTNDAARSSDASTNAANPVRIRIPSINVDAPVGPLGLDAAGALEVPTDFDATGWYEPGPEPGERGPAVIAGHVDSFRGPAVFFRLNALRDGQDVFVDRADGTTVTFRTRLKESYLKNSFPTEKVYTSTPNAQLRLITCGGQFDEAARRYLGNIVVYADMV